MKILTSVGPFSLLLAVLAAQLSGCATGNSAISGVEGAPKTSTGMKPARGSGGWMLPSAKNSDLLYVSNNAFNGELLALSFPGGELEGEVMIPTPYPAGLCSDSSGDVFVTTFGAPSQSYVYEYAHGGTDPIVTLNNPGRANGCAVDPTTGNLAVTNIEGGSVEIYEHAQGAPTAYVDPQISTYAYCTYDQSGNLFVDAFASGSSATIGELPAGSASFANVTLTKGIGPIAMQWRKGSIVTSGYTKSQFGKQPIYEIHVLGSVGTVSGPVFLWSSRNRNPEGSVQFAVKGGTLVEPGRGRGNAFDLLNFWKYPAGGRPKKVIHRPNGALVLYGVTFSAGLDSRIRHRQGRGRFVPPNGAR